jgi:hypothetical protein
MQRNWAIRRTEKLLLAACSTFWFQSCITDSENRATPEYGAPIPSSDGMSSSSEQAVSSSVELPSSSSMDVGPQPLYGVFYSSSSTTPSSSSLEVFQPEYGVTIPPSSSSSSPKVDTTSVLTSSSAAYGVLTPSSSSVAPSSSSLEIMQPLYGITNPCMPVTQCQTDK